MTIDLKRGDLWGHVNNVMKNELNNNYYCNDKANYQVPINNDAHKTGVVL